MNYGGKVTSLFILLLVACGDDESMTMGGSITGPTSTATTNPATTNSTPSSDTQDDTSASATDTTNSMPTTGTVEGAPVFLSFSANVATLTQDESVVFTASLTDPDGVADIVGGSLHNSDESLQFGPFVAAGQPGTYSVSLTWAQIHQTQPIDFDNGELSRGFRAVFFDQGGHKATDDVELTLACAGGAACDGTCTDLALDGLNCGMCGRVCDAGEDGCEAGGCLPVFGACVAQDDGLATCAEACQAAGETCVTQGCGNVTAQLYDFSNDCEMDIGSANGTMTCEEPVMWKPGAMYIRCCCSDTK